MVMLMILRLGKFREQLSDLRKHGNNNANKHTNTWVANMTLPARELGPALGREVPKDSDLQTRPGVRAGWRVVSRRVMMHVLMLCGVVHAEGEQEEEEMEVKVSRRMAELLEKNPSFSGEVPTPNQALECFQLQIYDA